MDKLNLHSAGSNSSDTVIYTREKQTRLSSFPPTPRVSRAPFSYPLRTITLCFYISIDHWNCGNWLSYKIKYKRLTNNSFTKLYSLLITHQKNAFSRDPQKSTWALSLCDDPNIVSLKTLCVTSGGNWTCLCNSQIITFILNWILH